MKKSKIIKLFIISFIVLAYLPFFSANIKADTNETEIVIEGVEEGGTYQTPNIKFYLKNKVVINKYVITTDKGEYDFNLSNNKMKIALLLDINGNIVYQKDKVKYVKTELDLFLINEDGTIKANEELIDLNNGNLTVNGEYMDADSYFKKAVSKYTLYPVLEKTENGTYYFINGVNTNISSNEKIIGFKTNGIDSSSIVSATLNGKEITTNTTLKENLFENGDYELKVVDSLGNVKIVNFKLYNEPYLLSVFKLLMKGAGNSIVVFIFTLALGIPLGLLGCVLKKISIKPFGFIKNNNKVLKYVKKFNPLKAILDLYTWVIRGTPLLLQLFVVYFGLPIMFGEKYALPPMTAACVTFIINYTAYFIEIFRGGMESINKGQFSSCYVLGMTKTQTYMKIILPQTVKKVLPSITNEAITLVKDTALASVITVHDILFYTKQKVSLDFRMDAYFVAAIIYLVFSLVIVTIFTRIEKKYSYYN